MNKEDVLKSVKEKIEKVKEGRRSASIKSLKEPQQRMRAIRKNIIRETLSVAERKYINGESDLSTAEFIETLTDKLSEPGTLGSLQESYISDISDLREVASELLDTEKAQRRLSTIESFKALIFRILTTIGVGFSILLVYWIAAKIPVAMPLIRVGSPPPQPTHTTNINYKTLREASHHLYWPLTKYNNNLNNEQQNAVGRRLAKRVADSWKL